MASVSVVLGVRFLPYLMGELRSTLVWGYQVHVLGHCLHAMIQAFVSKEESALSDGSLQYCLPLLMDVYIEEIAGDVAQQKYGLCLQSDTAQVARLEYIDNTPSE